MFETILTNVLAPGAFIGLFVALPLWWVLRGAARDRRRPDHRQPETPPRDPSLWISTAAILSGFGPSWHSPYLRPRVVPQLRAIQTKDGDPT